MFQNPSKGTLVKAHAHTHFYSFVAVCAHEIFGKCLIDLSHLLKDSETNTNNGAVL